jgi:hypothetical protein
MTQEEIISMAHEAGFVSFDEPNEVVSPYVEGVDLLPLLERFAKLVAEKEREACAKVCEATTYSDVGDYHSAKKSRSNPSKR